MVTKTEVLPDLEADVAEEIQDLLQEHHIIEVLNSAPHAFLPDIARQLRAYAAIAKTLYENPRGWLNPSYTAEESRIRRNCKGFVVKLADIEKEKVRIRLHDEHSDKTLTPKFEVKEIELSDLGEGDRELTLIGDRNRLEFLHIFLPAKIAAALW